MFTFGWSPLRGKKLQGAQPQGYHEGTPRGHVSWEFTGTASQTVIVISDGVPSKSTSGPGGKFAKDWRGIQAMCNSVWTVVQ